MRLPGRKEKHMNPMTNILTTLPLTNMEVENQLSLKERTMVFQGFPEGHVPLPCDVFIRLIQLLCS